MTFTKTLAFFTILALGLFLAPKQAIISQTSLECCATSASTSTSCCDTKEHGKKQHHGGTEEDCKENCHHCGTCHSVVALYLKTEHSAADQTPSFSDLRSKFLYMGPHILAVSAKIWQPPKIG